MRAARAARHGMREGAVESDGREQQGDQAEADAEAEQQPLPYERLVDAIGQRNDAPHHVRGIGRCDPWRSCRAIACS